jgi:hypothetical protein
MSIAANTTPMTTIRFTSIEPLKPFGGQFKEIAETNGCEFKVNDESIVNAPFCGVNYHVQEVSLSSIVPKKHNENIANCIKHFSQMEVEQFADGYFEVLG